jgi:hypothetical protein
VGDGAAAPEDERSSRLGGELTRRNHHAQTDQARDGTGTAVAALLAVPAAAATAASSADDFVQSAEAAGGQRSLDDTGNMIFIHPDGTDAAYWEAGRIYWDGPDADSEWDLLPEATVYRGHMADQLEGTSNGGATVHAFGFKVDGPGSFGTDSGAEDVRAGDAAAPRLINSPVRVRRQLVARGRQRRAPRRDHQRRGHRRARHRGVLGRGRHT